MYFTQLKEESAMPLLVDQGSLTDQIGTYTSQPRTLTLETASESILSISSSVSANSGSLDLDASDGAVKGKVSMMLLAFLGVSVVLGGL